MGSQEILYQATKAYATNRPSAIHWGMPIDMNPEATTRLGHLIPRCITGNFDVPGGNVAARGAFGIAMWPINASQVLETMVKSSLRLTRSASVQRNTPT